MANPSTTKGKQMTAVLYARYSSDKQREASIDDQLRVCHDYCNAAGIKIVGQYTDYALSGKTDQRPEFRRMIANAPESDFVVVYMFDRFSRDRYDSATYKRALRECGVRVISASEKVEDTPEGGLQEGLLELLSEYYVKDLARKVRRGMEGNALKAKDNGYRVFGYRTDPETRRYVIDEREAKAVRDMFSRHIAGESMCSIAASMAREGWKTSRGTPVSYNWVWRVLTRKAYTGLYSWGGIEVEGGMPQIIDEETWERARNVPKKKPREIENWADYRLSGKLYCGLCGGRMHGYGGTGRSGRRYYYYGCKVTSREQSGCKRPGVRREVVEGAFAKAVLRVTSDERAMREFAHRAVTAYDLESDLHDRIESCQDAIAELEREQHNLTKAALRGFVNEETITRNGEIAAELAALRADLKELIDSQDERITEDDIVEYLAHGIDASDEELIFDIFASKVYLFQDEMLAVLSLRNSSGDLTEVRTAIDHHRRAKEKSENPEGFPLCSSGVRSRYYAEPITLPNGVGLLIPLVAVS